MGAVKLNNLKIASRYIEELRYDLEKALKEKNNLIDTDILFLSRKLDNSINLYYRISEEKKSKEIILEKDI